MVVERSCELEGENLKSIEKNKLIEKGKGWRIYES